MSPEVACRSPLYPLLTIAISVLATGCAATTPVDLDPLTGAADEQLDTGDRLDAIERAERDLVEGELEPDRFREVLKNLAWSRNERPQLRMRAIEALAAQDETDTVRMLSLMLPTETQWSVIGGVGDMASERGWTGVTTGLVRSWAREVEEPPDDERPERAALVALHPEQPVPDIVFGVFRDPEVSDLFREDARRDAWALLTRIDESGRRTKTLLAEGTFPSGDPIISALQSGARELHVAPASTEQLEWLQSLRSDDQRPAWTRYRELVANLTPEQREGLEIRHLAAIDWTARFEPEWLETTRAELLDRCAQLLKGRNRIRRVAGAPDRMAAPHETIDEWEDDLVWADALSILIADRAVADRSVVESVLEFAGADRRDTTTEYGGVIDAVPRAADASSSAEPDFRATLYEPRPTQRGGDQRFIAPPEMITESVTALFHFHLQAQSVRNREYAGPSRGDLEYARTHGRSCLVFTSISEDSMNVDYYQPDGARIDLGIIRKPD